MAKGSHRERKLLSLDRSSTGVEKIPDSSHFVRLLFYRTKYDTNGCKKYSYSSQFREQFCQTLFI